MHSYTIDLLTKILSLSSLCRSRLIEMQSKILQMGPDCLGRSVVASVCTRLMHVLIMPCHCDIWHVVVLGNLCILQSLVYSAKYKQSSTTFTTGIG